MEFNNNTINSKHNKDCDCDDCQSHGKKYDGDGVENHENLLDLFEQSDVLYENIKDNTDSAFTILKNLENKEDEDLLDVLRINCSEILEVEKQTKDIYENIKKSEINLKEKFDTVSDAKISMIQEFFESLVICEKVSNEKMERFYKLLKQINS